MGSLGKFLHGRTILRVTGRKAEIQEIVHRARLGEGAVTCKTEEIRLSFWASPAL